MKLEKKIIWLVVFPSVGSHALSVLLGHQEHVGNFLKSPHKGNNQKTIINSLNLEHSVLPTS